MRTWPRHDDLVAILNQSAVLYLSGVAAAIGFRMNLFNIGVEGQYRLAGLVAGCFAGAGLAARLPQHGGRDPGRDAHRGRCGPASRASCGSPAGSAR